MIAPTAVPRGTLQDIPLDLVDVGDNVRVNIAELEELTASIAEHGILQPVKVVVTDGDRYRLVWGQRRVLAARAAGLTMIPAIVEYAESEGTGRSIEQLVENLHRADLNPIDRADLTVRAPDSPDVAVRVRVVVTLECKHFLAAGAPTLAAVPDPGPAKAAPKPSAAEAIAAGRKRGGEVMHQRAEARKATTEREDAKPRSNAAWTPEKRAAQAERVRQIRAAKKIAAQPVDWRGHPIPEGPD